MLYESHFIICICEVHWGECVVLHALACARLRMGQGDRDSVCLRVACDQR